MIAGDGRFPRTVPRSGSVPSCRGQTIDHLGSVHSAGYNSDTYPYHCPNNPDHPMLAHTSSGDRCVSVLFMLRFLAYWRNTLLGFTIKLRVRVCFGISRCPSSWWWWWGWGLGWCGDGEMFSFPFSCPPPPPPLSLSLSLSRQSKQVGSALGSAVGHAVEHFVKEMSTLLLKSLNFWTCSCF